LETSWNVLQLYSLHKLRAMMVMAAASRRQFRSANAPIAAIAAIFAMIVMAAGGRRQSQNVDASIPGALLSAIMEMATFIGLSNAPILSSYLVHSSFYQVEPRFTRCNLLPSHQTSGIYRHLSRKLSLSLFANSLLHFPQVLSDTV
jgi:hypothetical protein